MNRKNLFEERGKYLLLGCDDIREVDAFVSLKARLFFPAILALQKPIVATVMLLLA